MLILKYIFLFFASLVGVYSAFCLTMYIFYMFSYYKCNTFSFDDVIIESNNKQSTEIINNKYWNEMNKLKLLFPQINEQINERIKDEMQMIIDENSNKMKELNDKIKNLEKESEIKHICFKNNEISEEDTDEEINLKIKTLHTELNTLQNSIPTNDETIKNKALINAIRWYNRTLENNYIIENIEKYGNIIMRYFDKNEGFEYYSDKKIPYVYLELVARKYVITYQCVWNYKDGTYSKKIIPHEDVIHDSVFISPKKKSTNKITIKNKYTYKGKINNYKLIQPITIIPLTFLEYKKIKSNSMIR